MEISDFAGALRQMADNALLVAERHDVAEIAALRRQVEEQAVKAQRDGDLIDELRRQVKMMGRSLDGVGRMRKGVLAFEGFGRGADPRRGHVRPRRPVLQLRPRLVDLPDGRRG
jgi:hypothetical protein